MKIDTPKIALASGTTGTVVFTLCTLFVFVAPEATVWATRQLFHLAVSAPPEVTWGGFVTGLIFWFGAPAAVVAAVAGLVNRWGGTDAAAVASGRRNDSEYVTTTDNRADSPPTTSTTEQGETQMKAPTLLMIAAISLTALPGLAQQMPEQHDHGAMNEKDAGEMSCAGMMKMHDQMKEKMAAMDAKLDGLVAEMNKARGSAKVDKMAAVINELVTQRKQMRNGMMKMQPMMMQHMMGHMQSGMMKGMKEGMSGCPMMEKGEMDPSGSDDHEHN